MIIERLKTNDLELMDELLDLFGHEFEEQDTYCAHRPDKHYQRKLLDQENCIVLTAIVDDHVRGGLVAYELPKFEQQRSEIYIYDLAVAREFRRQGIATKLINALKPIAREKKAWVIFVQADHVDEPAVNLYNKLGVREEVLHFDIDPKE